MRASWFNSHTRRAVAAPGHAWASDAAWRGTIRPVTEPDLPPAPRFPTLDDVAAELAISRSQTDALVRGVAAAEAEAGEAGEAYAAAWNAGKDAGWSPAQLRAMGYAKPPTARAHTRCCSGHFRRRTIAGAERR